MCAEQAALFFNDFLCNNTAETKKLHKQKIGNCDMHSQGPAGGTTIDLQKQQTFVICCINKWQEKMHNWEGSKK